MTEIPAPAPFPDPPPPPSEGPVRGHDGVASLVPFGLERAKPRIYRSLARALWGSREELGFAASVLTRGVCDGCGLGPRGLRDDVLDGPHLCEIRLERLRGDTLPPLAPADLFDIKRLKLNDSAGLRDLGRLSHPYLYRRGDRGFTPLSWEQAMDWLAERCAGLPPERVGLLAAGSRLTNEAAFVLAKGARLMGCPNLDQLGRAEHAAGLGALAGSLGHAASTASISDLVGADLIVLLGTDLAARQPVALGALAAAKERGARVVVVGERLDESQLSYWDPARPLGALFGASVLDDYIAVAPGGEAALLRGALKVLLGRAEVNAPFIERSTAGWAELAAWLEAVELDALAAEAGADARDLAWLGELYGRAATSVTVIGDGLCARGAAGVQAVVNIHLARGHLGLPKAGVLAFVGQGPGGLDCGLCPAEGGLDAPGMLAAGGERLDLLYAVGADLLEPARLGGAAGVAGLVFQDTLLSPACLAEPGEWTLLLPSRTRHEQPGGGTTTSFERRIRLSPEIEGAPAQRHRRPDWEIPGRVLGALRPAVAGPLQYADGRAVRAELAREIPRYAGVEHLRREGEWVQWGGPQLYTSGVFDALPDGRARFVTPEAGP